ncbi:hypothetical protein AB8Z38_28935 [Bradyrhizobium sp. LLZ17]|uniref:EAL domain-containing protein n=1 Tax=Bradyrhizobium sp. LLZ17 TaxID=3239388 RepID=A0AB39XHY3_9BRAD
MDRGFAFGREFDLSDLDALDFAGLRSGQLYGQQSPRITVKAAMDNCPLLLAMFDQRLLFALQGQQFGLNLASLAARALDDIASVGFGSMSISSCNFFLECDRV